MVKLRNFLLPERDLAGRQTKAPVEVKGLEETFERARELTDRLYERRKEGKIWKLAKLKISKKWPTIDLTSDEKGLGEVDRVAREMMEHEKFLDKIARTKFPPRVQVQPSVLQPGIFGIAWTMRQNRLVKVRKNRFEPGDPIPWIRVQIWGSKKPLGLPERDFMPLWQLKGKDVLFPVQPQGYSEWWVDIYPQDFLYILKFSLTPEQKVDKRDWDEIIRIYGKNFQVFYTEQPTDTFGSRRKLRRLMKAQ